MLIVFPTHITYTTLMLRACLIVCISVLVSLLNYVIEFRSCCPIVCVYKQQKLQLYNCPINEDKKC